MPSIAEVGQRIREIVRKHLKEKRINCDNLVVNKKQASTSKEDFVIPIGCHSQIEQNVLISLRDDLTHRLQSDGLPVAKIDGDKWNSFCVHLDRTRLYKDSIVNVLERGSTYGHNIIDCEQLGRVLLNIVGPTQRRPGDISKNLSLDWVRLHIIQQHIQLLLQAQGRYQVQTIACDGVVNHHDLLQQILVDPSLIQIIDSNKCLVTGTLEYILQHSHVTRIQWESQDSVDSPTCSKEMETEENPVSPRHDGKPKKYFLSVMDLKKYMTDKGILVGKTHFDKNLTVCNVAKLDKPSDLCRQACALDAVVQETSPAYCIHIVGQNRSLQQQKLHLMLQAAMEGGAPHTVQQAHFIHGPVIPRKDGKGGDVTSATQYISLRNKQMREAAIMKYGDAVKGGGWEDTLRSLTAACIKFELLSTVARNTVKLSLSEIEMEGGGELTSGGSFVMYNCARLATLFSHYDEAVTKGTYPALPAVKDIDWSTLREEQEWVLLFDYVCMFPEVIQHSVTDLTPADSIHTKVYTHKVCQFLCSLSRCLSSYYSRYHVLGESRSHLMPTMFARLYLLKAIHQVLVNGLALLGIPPLSQLSKVKELAKVWTKNCTVGDVINVSLVTAHFLLIGKCG